METDNGDRSEPVASHATHDDEAACSRDPYEVYPLSVDDIRSKLFTLGISKSKDSIQRYCREGTLTCVKLGMLRRYYATEASVDALIETLQNDAPSSDGMQHHEHTDRLMQVRDDGDDGAIQLHAPASMENPTQNNELHAAALTDIQPDTAASIGTQVLEVSESGKDAGDGRADVRNVGDNRQILDFLKEQIRVKDEQIKVKDEQIAAMLERDRETNILIRGLQDRIGDAFGLLVSGKREIDNHIVRNANSVSEDILGSE